MTTYPQDTLKSQDVYTFTINTLDTLPLEMPGAIDSRDLLRVLVFAAASRLSVHQACDQLERAPSGPTVLPYHGTVDAAHQDEVCRSKAKGGMTHFFTYATAYVVVRGCRYTLAMCRVRAKQTMDRVVRTLLTRVDTLGIRLKLVLFDRGFYSVRVMRDLITAELPFIMPAVKRGKKATNCGRPHRHLCSGGHETRSMDPLYLEQPSRGARRL